MVLALDNLQFALKKTHHQLRAAKSDTCHMPSYQSIHTSQQIKKVGVTSLYSWTPFLLLFYIPTLLLAFPYLDYWHLNITTSFNTFDSSPMCRFLFLAQLHNITGIGYCKHIGAHYIFVLQVIFKIWHSWGTEYLDTPLLFQNAHK